MINRKMIGTVIVGLLLGVATLPMASTAFAAANTSGLAALSLKGVGTGTLAGPATTCGTLACKGGDTCECLTGAESLVGNQGFAKGSLTFTVIIDETLNNLPVSTFGNCFPGTGTGTIASSNGKNTVTLDISGLSCPTSGIDVFNGTYVVSGGTGKYSASSGGTGALNGSQDGAAGASQANITGSLQPK